MPKRKQRRARIQVRALSDVNLRTNKGVFHTAKLHDEKCRIDFAVIKDSKAAEFPPKKLCHR
jgi:hypothetical protein